jgi:hypothetical protein
MHNFKIKPKQGQIFLPLPEGGFEPQIFSNFPAHDLNFHVKFEARDQIRTSF